MVIRFTDGKPRDHLFEAMADLAGLAGYDGACASLLPRDGYRAMAQVRNVATHDSIRVEARDKRAAYAMMSRLLLGLMGPPKAAARARAERIAAGECSVLAGWCLTHNVESDPGHSFDHGNLSTLD